jgi:hypothetical protein
MKRDELFDFWRSKQAEWDRLGMTANAARLVEAMLADVDAVFRGEEGEELTLSEAALRSGYSSDHLSRLLREGKLQNVGRKGRPRIRAGDLPRRAPACGEPGLSDNIGARRRIALAVASSEPRSA